MADSNIQPHLWYDHYQGILYPLDLKAAPSLKQYKRTCTVNSLINLCAEYIVRDSSMTCKAVENVPGELCIPLMSAALRDNRDRAMDVLISHWPLETLSLSKLTENLFTSLKPLYDSTYQAEIVRQSLRYTTCLAHTFVECLKKRTPTKLKYLDITGYPTAGVILFYLSSHCLLALNEARQNTMVDMYNRIVSLQAEQNKQNLLSTDNCLPDACIMIKLDAFVSSDQAHAELCKALRVSGFQQSMFKLCLRHLDATCLGRQKVEIMLKEVNRQYLKGLRLTYNSLNVEDLTALLPMIENFTCLVALDLSCNCINFYKSDHTCDLLSNTLSKLPNLRRLDLSNNRIKAKLERILGNIQSPLLQLRLVACGLTKSDLACISNSHHVNGLEELDLSENNFSQSSLALGKLICRCKSLLTLELEDCLFNDENLRCLMSYICTSQCLMFINLAQNLLLSDTWQFVVESLSRCSSLSVLKMCYPNACYMHEEDSDVELSKKTFEELLKMIIVKEKDTLGSTDYLGLVIVESEKIDYHMS